MHNKKVIKLFIIVVLLVLYVLGFYALSKNKRNNIELEIEKINQEKISEISSHYAKNVKINNDTKLYSIDNDNYVVVGSLAAGVELSLSEIEITADTEFFKVTNFGDNYFVRYEDLIPIDQLTVNNGRYKNYILFNENVKTKDITKFYFDGNLVYEINQNFNLPIIKKDDNKIYVEYQDKLLYVLYEEIDSIVENNNTTFEPATEITTLVYHFIYDSDNGESCNQIICHKMSQVQSHIDYLKQENFFTLTMKEFEDYVDGKIRLPKKSVLITIDDGWYGGNAQKIFTDNQINASMFIITAGYNASGFVTDYIEVHSHGDNLHNPGICPGGQGGAIKCADKAMLLEDLRLSREKTFNSTAFCYPFYEYNDYAIEVLKEAGFTMAFAGEKAGGHYKMPVGGNKFKIPRITILYSTTIDEFKQILNS